MLLKRLAHACFGLEDDSNRIWLFDPYRPDGLNGCFSLPEIHVRPHIILCTHAHEDHAWRARNWEGIPVWEADTQTEEATLQTQAVPHDCGHGTQMGFSRALRLQLRNAKGSITVVHGGDIGEGEGHRLINFCQGADLLLLPAGGHFTMGPEEAVDLAQKSGARYAVLMHFREPGIDLKMLTPDEAFAQLNIPVTRVESGEFEVQANQGPGETEFLWLAPGNTSNQAR